jgi:hypothetical protein
MTSVAEQLAEKRKANRAAAPATETKPAVTKAGTKTASTRSKAPKAKAKAEPTAPAETDTIAEMTPDTEEAEPKSRKIVRTPEEQEAYDKKKAEKKEAAFAKLRDMNAKKKAARSAARAQEVQELNQLLTPGDIKYSTRASYYGIKCRVEKVEEVRGRVLVTVTCMTTKKGQPLAEDSYYTRRFSPNFLQDEYPEEEYEPRRGGKPKRKPKAEKKTRSGRKAKAVAAEGEEEAELEDLELEDEADEEAELEDESDEDEDDLDEDEDEDDEEDEDDDDEVEAESDAAVTGETAEEDSWG